MSAEDFDLPADLETLLQQVCHERGIAAREHDGLRTLLQSPPESWPSCCRAECKPCIDDHARVAREVLARRALPLDET
jgi:hypothetical protein